VSGTVVVNTKTGGSFQANRYHPTQYVALVQGYLSDKQEAGKEYNTVTAMMIFAIPGQGAEDVSKKMVARGSMGTTVAPKTVKASNPDELMAKLTNSTPAVDTETEIAPF